MEGEGNGKRDRELGRWGQEAGERVLPTATSPEAGAPPPTRALLPLPPSPKLPATAENRQLILSWASALRARGRNGVLRRRGWVRVVSKLKVLKNVIWAATERTELGEDVARSLEDRKGLGKGGSWQQHSAGWHPGPGCPTGQGRESHPGLGAPGSAHSA